VPGDENCSVKESPARWLGASVCGSESHCVAFGETPVTEWARSGPIQSQVTFSPRSISMRLLDQVNSEIETRVLRAAAVELSERSAAATAISAAAHRPR
jgi:hypothetical protein